ncbi:hypothetical protein [Arcobacter sp. FWKO B]|uniref:hypothetical protein n=1 Tax=Arcobacter sp. FWKO B TaxID=2593672 RepID=UPI0018A53F68|nr:hypothetical protein [Arcobacter sp. FWKO B]QOG11341.1 hypothetical protein FWKOB_00925 [Arcobacter sp. FWKO B]
MTLSQFLSNFKEQSDAITYLSVEHMLKKLYKLDDEINDIEGTLCNYPLYLRYLNDFAGKIYKHYDSSIEEVYNKTCEILKIESDNKYLFDYRLNKLELNDVSRIMQIQNDDIKAQTVEKQYTEFEKLIESKYYQENQEKYKSNITKIQRNFELLKQLIAEV